MCQRVTCSSCGKPSFVGCGRHVEQVLGDVLPEERCACREEKAADDRSLASRIAGLFRR
jgi:hypothetical protein